MTLPNVRPVLTADYMMDGWRGHSEVRGDFAVFHTIRPHHSNATNIIRRQLGSTVTLTNASAGPTGWVGIAAEVPASAFSIHVSDVIDLRAEEQVIWSDAQRCVAAMENLQPIKDRPVGQFPGYAVRHSHLAPNAEVAVHGVPASRVSSGPQPTSLRLLDFRPEPLGDRAKIGSGFALVDASRHGGLL